jgi:ABC-type Zn uptake system ZnuABC Zn-binding protein ZnuA
MKQYFLLTRVLLIVLAITGFVGTSNDIAADDALQVLATTDIIADVVQNIGGDLVEVTTLIPSGSDPHSYVPTPRDVVRIIDAEVIFINGMNLEEGLLDIIAENASVEPVVVSIDMPVLSGDYPDVVGEEFPPYIGMLGEDGVCGVDVEEEGAEGDEAHDEHDHGPCDPHVWMNPGSVGGWALTIAGTFTDIDPANAQTYWDNASVYAEKIAQLQEEIAAMVETIPIENKVLLTNHAFLNYFAVGYGFEIAGVILPGGTNSEVDPRALADLIDLVEDRQIPAIFGEASANNDLAETVAAEVNHDVAVVILYTGSLSDEDGPASTYIDYMRYNASLIVEALAGE